MAHVLHVLGFPPDRIGGTEVYVADLAQGLLRRGYTCTLVAPQGDHPITEHAGLPVESYPVNAAPGPDEMRLNRPHQGFETFEVILARYPGAIYHQHSWTRGCGGHHLHAAKARGMPTVLTLHVPGNLCLRGDMMRYAVVPCDGRIDTRRCAACWSHGRGLSAPAAKALSHLPLAIARQARGHRGRIGTALSARALVEDKQTAVAGMITDSDRLIVPAHWTEEALLANGAPASKITLNRQGVSVDFLEALADRPPTTLPADGLSLLYLGSWNPLKGIDIAVRAVLALPRELGVRLTIHAPVGGAEEQAYEAKVRSISGADPRVVYAGPAPRQSLPALFARHHALVVPSIWFETGPLVAMEALAAGLFVIGSRLGGVAENLVGRSGAMLVETGDVPAWTEAFRRLALEGVPQGPGADLPAARSMDDVAREMAEVYQGLAA